MGWKEVVRLRFKGKRFHDHALDLSALAELSQFQKMVAETAKELWRAAHPDRERLPAHFEERTRLCLRKIEDGSAATPLEIYVEEEPQTELWEPEEQEPKELREAVDLAYEVIDAVERNSVLPERFPRQLLSEYVKWGQMLREDEEVEIQPSSKNRPTRTSAKHRERLAALQDQPHENVVDKSGEVLEADVKQRRFQLWLDENTRVTVNFSEEQESEVTTALKEHKTLRLRVKGRGEFSAAGNLLRVTCVDEMQIQPLGEASFDRSARSIEEELEMLAKEVPQEEWDRLPKDLSANLDHYLYGTDKK